jgi:hypothetical protein
MSSNTYRNLLLARHRQIDTEIKEEEARFQPDGTRLRTLKKRKLRIKDQIAVS